MPSHFLNQCWVNWAHRNEFKWNFNENTKASIHENASENIFCEIAARDELILINYRKHYIWNKMNAFPDSLVHPVTFRCPWKQNISYTIFICIYASILHNVFKNNTLKLLMKLALSEHHDEVFTYVDNPYATHICNVDYVPAQHTMAVRRIQRPMAVWPGTIAEYCHWVAVDYAWNISLIACITITQIRQSHVLHYI